MTLRLLPLPLVSAIPLPKLDADQLSCCCLLRNPQFLVEEGRVGVHMEASIMAAMSSAVQKTTRREKSVRVCWSFLSPATSKRDDPNLRRTTTLFAIAFRVAEFLQKAPQFLHQIVKQDLLEDFSSKAPPASAAVAAAA
jgi:hypothetical protein